MTFTEEQKQQLAEKNLLQIAEFASFSADLTNRLTEAVKDDGKIGIMEGIKIGLSLSGSAVDALQGVSQIPAELTTLDAADVELIGDIIFPSFAGFPEYHQELVSAAIGVTREIVNLAQLIRNRSVPRAIVVDTPEGAD